MSILSKVPLKKHKSSWMNLSHENKMSLPFNRLVPISCEDTLPGDKFKLDLSNYTIMAPTVAPILQSMTMKAYSFFVPNRIIWDQWEEFISEAPEDAMPLHPQFTAFEVLKFYDCFTNMDAGLQNDWLLLLAGREDLSELPNWCFDLVNVGASLTGRQLNVRKNIMFIALLSQYVGDSSLMDFLGMPSMIDALCQNPNLDETYIFNAVCVNTLTTTQADKQICSERQVTDPLSYVRSMCAQFRYLFSIDIPDYVYLNIAADKTQIQSDPNIDSGRITTLYEWLGADAAPYFYSSEFVTDLTQDVTSMNLPLDPFPIIAYHLVYNEYFRYEPVSEDKNREYWWTNFNDWTGESLDPDADNTSKLERLIEFFSMEKKGWNRDYFTSCLPDPQLGEPVQIPSSSTTLYSSGYNEYVDMSGSKSGRAYGNLTNISYDDSNEKLDVVTGVGTIEQLRVANKLQQFREILARTGHRYKESIYGLFGIVVPDYRLDRPEFCGASNLPLRVGLVQQTSATEKDSVLGNFAGFGEIKGNTNHVSYSCGEHGWFLTFVAVVPNAAYGQGLAPKFRRLDRYDYAWPQFASLGEQEVKPSEIFCLYRSGQDNKVPFGYLPRYSDYKTRYNEFHGDFKNSLSYWHMGRIFDTEPTLEQEFVSVDDPTVNRVFDTNNLPTDKLYCQFMVRMYVRRRLPKYVIPHL